MRNYTSGTVHMFELELGDGTRYTVLFSRLPPTGEYFEGYTVYAALVGLHDTGAPDDWHGTWRNQLPAATLG